MLSLLVPGTALAGLVVGGALDPIGQRLAEQSRAEDEQRRAERQAAAEGEPGEEPSGPATADPVTDEFDRQRRRVLWALPTGLYLVGSRSGDDVNLMTANLVVQVCLEPKLVGVAIEAESTTAALVARSSP